MDSRSRHALGGAGAFLTTGFGGGAFFCATFFTGGRLVGENIRIDVVFTPYQEEDGNLLLVAQGQVWYSEVSEVSKVKTRYLTSIQSLPVSLGEKVLFFPLGVSNEEAGTKTLNIQLEVEIFPYRELLDNPAD